MATWYVSYDGDDANGGTSWSDAKATIGAAVSVASSGDTINVGEGVYKEFIDPAYKGLNFYGFGRVVVDGENVRKLLNRMGPSYIINNFIFQNSTSWQGMSPVNPVGFQNCIFRNISYGIGTPPTYAGVEMFRPDLSNCLFINCKIIFTGNIGFSYRYCTFDSQCILYHNSTVNGSIIRDCNFSCPVYFKLSSFGILNYNNYFNSIYAYVGDNWVLKTFAEWKELTGKDTNSLNVAPQFLDESYEDFFLKASSQIKTASSEGKPIGWGGVGNHTNVLSAESHTATLSNVHVDDKGQYVLDEGATEGTVTFDVIDFGSTKTFTRIIWSATEDPPSSVIAHSDETSAPNYKYVEYRVSDTAFAKNDATPSWQTAWNGQKLSGVSGRYFQYRIRLTTQFGV